jgi:hypothetical protein
MSVGTFKLSEERSYQTHGCPRFYIWSRGLVSGHGF